VAWVTLDGDMGRLCSGKTSRSGCYLVRKEEGRIPDLVDPSRPSSLLGCVQDPSWRCRLGARRSRRAQASGGQARSAPHISRRSSQA